MKLALVAALTAALLVGCSGDPDQSSEPPAGTSSSSASSSPGAPDPSAPTGPGDPDVAPTNAALADFCSALKSSVPDPDGGEVATFAATLARTGTPADLTLEQRGGFELYLGAIQEIDPEATKEELREKPNLGFSGKESKKVRAFFTYATAACGEPAA